MKKIIYLMAIAIAAVTFTGCTDDNHEFLADVKLPAEAIGNTMVVDAWANNFTVTIKNEKEWRIESSDFIKVIPSEGKGNATVKVLVEDNEEEQRLKGNVNIVFPGHEEQNKAFAVEQKWTGEYDENADAIGTSNKIYAVGYGYDTTKGLYANKTCLKAQIFKTGQLIEEGIEATDGNNMFATVNTITGNSISELSNKLTVKAGASGGVGKFKAEANAAFTMNYTDNSTHEYAINYLEAFLTTASFDLPIEDLRTEEYMTAKAYKAINGLNRNYSSNNDGFMALIRAYGTHVVMSAKLGGRIRQSLDVDTKDITESYDLKVFAKASYEGVFAKAEGSVDDDFHKSFKKHQNNIKTSLEATGGDSKLAKALLANNGFTEENYGAWLRSVDGTNLSLMGFNDDSLLPLYELVDKEKFPERYDSLHDYITGEQIAKDFGDNSTYDSGTVTEFDVPDFTNNHGYNKTLIKDIMLGGQLVGQVCEEYIPTIDRTKRVVVIYPVIGTTVRYNMGFFIGDENHKPARVAWNGTNTNISEYPELNFGQVTKLYLRGASITTTPAEDVDVKKGFLVDEYLDGIRKNAPKNGNISSKYPLVKIFDKIWTRENYRREIIDGDNTNWGHYVYNGVDGQSDTYWEEYYKLHSAQTPDLFPAGWRVASGTDFQEMKNKLSANGWGMPGLALKMGSVTGFDIVWSGWVDKGTGGYTNSPDQMEYVTPDACHIRLKKDGTFDICSGEYHAGNWLMCVRLVKQ